MRTHRCTLHKRPSPPHTPQGSLMLPSQSQSPSGMPAPPQMPHSSTYSHEPSSMVAAHHSCHPSVQPAHESYSRAIVKVAVSHSCGAQCNQRTNRTRKCHRRSLPLHRSCKQNRLYSAQVPTRIILIVSRRVVIGCRFIGTSARIAAQTERAGPQRNGDTNEVRAYPAWEHLVVQLTRNVARVVNCITSTLMEASGEAFEADGRTNHEPPMVVFRTKPWLPSSVNSVSMNSFSSSARPGSSAPLPANAAGPSKPMVP